MGKVEITIPFHITNGAPIPPPADEELWTQGREAKIQRLEENLVCNQFFQVNIGIIKADEELHDDAAGLGHTSCHQHPDFGQFFIFLDGPPIAVATGKELNQLTETPVGPGKIFYVPPGIYHQLRLREPGKACYLCIGSVPVNTSGIENKSNNLQPPINFEEVEGDITNQIGSTSLRVEINPLLGDNICDDGRLMIIIGKGEIEIYYVPPETPPPEINPNKGRIIIFSSICNK